MAKKKEPIKVKFFVKRADGSEVPFESLPHEEKCRIVHNGNERAMKAAARIAGYEAIFENKDTTA